ncbi:MAG TPA: caspase family protein, partial [Pyrinomonadaceae bacterium]|nr:caspase family protein [Pyrinomonadaceae bacterium]
MKLAASSGTPFASLLLSLSLLPLGILLRASALRDEAQDIPARAAQAEVTRPSPPEKDYAFVVGVGRYAEGWPTFPDAESGVREVGAALRRLGFKVKLLVNPKRSELLKGFQRFLDDVQSKGGRAVVYFAGHEFVLNPPNETPRTYLVLPKTPSPHLLMGSPGDAKARLDVSAVNYEEIVPALERIKG